MATNRYKHRLLRLRAEQQRMNREERVSIPLADLKALQEEVETLKRENQQLKAEAKTSLENATSMLEEPRPRLCMVGLTVLDIHACPVRQIPEGGKVEMVDQIRLTMAGTCGGTAVTAAILGAEVHVFAAIGTDEQGDFLCNRMKAVRIVQDGIQRLAQFPTSSTVINVRPNGDRPALHALGASDHLKLSDSDCARIGQLVSPTAQETDGLVPILHIGSIGLSKGCEHEQSVLRLLERMRTDYSLPPNILISMDLIAPHEGMPEVLSKALGWVDYFMPSLEEAEELAGKTGARECGQHFLEMGVRRAVVLKSGAEGSYLIRRAASESSGAGGVACEVIHIPACRDVTVVDTTGCGDAYCSGFLVGLSRGLDEVEACRAGTAAAALCCSGVGSDAGNSGWEETLRYLVAHS